MEQKFEIKKYIALLLAGVLLSILYHGLLVRKAVIELDLETDKQTVLKVYWLNESGFYSEENMVRIRIRPGLNIYRFHICNLDKVSSIRIDTSERPARVTLKSLVIKQEGYPTFKYDSKSGLDQLVEIEGIRKLTLDDTGLVVIPEGRDPQLLLQLPEITRTSTLLSETVRMGCIFISVYLLAWVFSGITEQYLYVNCLLVFVFALIIVMAEVSKYNKHPDEFVHIYAAEYYQNHTLPPRIEDPEILHTYSNYGVSRLHSGEIVYFLAGKFLKLAEPLYQPSFLILRFFNIFLFSILLLGALKKMEFRLVLLPVLISPQTWYVFSYFNSDAFALFVILLVGYQVAVADSMLNILLRKGMTRKTWYYFLLTGLLLGVMLLLKKNFYFFYVFLFLFCLWKVVFSDWTADAKFLFRLSSVLLVAFSVFGLSRGVDYYVNGFDRGEKLFEAREHLALDMYKPSTPLPLKHGYLQMKDRGTTLKHFLQKDRWGEKSFRTSFGVYGYVSISGPSIYYDIVRIFGLFLLAAIILPVLVRGGLSGVLLLMITLSVSLALVVVAMYHAWTVDFQAQGRYFLPILAMCSVYICHVERCLIRPVFHFLILVMFLLSVYNFVFVGLYEIAKYGT